MYKYALLALSCIGMVVSMVIIAVSLMVWIMLESLDHGQAYLHFHDENNNRVSVKVTLTSEEYSKLIGHSCKFNLRAVTYCH